MPALPIAWFDYELPPELIAQEPARPRDASRLLVLARAIGAVRHAQFRDLPELLSPGDLLVVNRTKVIPARLRVRKPTGGQVELLFVRPVGARWDAMARPAKGLHEGVVLEAPGGATLRVAGREGELLRIEGPVARLIEEHGELPLPPYIERPAGGRAADRDDYQTLFAREPGAVAAPTAALHFSDRVLSELWSRGIGKAEITLHVGPGTFLPVRQEHYADVRAHPMHAEWYEVPAATIAAMAAAREAGQRVVAVGTTTVRALETWAAGHGPSGESRLFIYPGFSFRAVDALLTNFHLPRSTLLMLVAAFAGREVVLNAYAEAVRLRYRFFSYGDAMLAL